MQNQVGGSVGIGAVCEYRLNKATKYISFFLFAIFLGTAALFFVVFLWLHGNMGRILLAPALIALFAGIALGVSVARSRILMFSGSIAVRGALRTRELAFHEIRGRREFSTRGGTCLVLVPKDSRAKSLSIAPNFNLDEAWHKWFGALPDLDSIDKREKLQEIASDAALGTTPDERLAKLRQARKTAIMLSVAPVVVALLAWLFTSVRPAAAALFAILPWAPIYLLFRSPQLYRIAGASRTDPRMSLDLAIWIPCAGFVVTATAGAYHVNMRPALWLICLSGIALAGALTRPLLSNGGASILVVMMLALSAAYGLGAGFAANRFLDQAPVRVYRTLVASKHTSTGKSGTTYYVDLDPWGPKTEVDSLEVSSRVYRSLQQGDPACLALHPGALKMGWYTMEACP
jgi:hypothetical protein